MAPMTKTSGLSPLLPVPWAGVRAWLDEAEATSAASGGSTAHLAHAQLLALSQLVTFGVDEPVLPKEDYVSKLMRMSSSPVPEDDHPMQDGVDAVRFANGPEFTQVHRFGPPTFEMSDPVDVPFRGAFQLRWGCQCVLPWCGKRFPSGDEARPPVLFGNKKDAKQYAAMLAVEYLKGATRQMATSHTPRETPEKLGLSENSSQNAPQQPQPPAPSHTAPTQPLALPQPAQPPAQPATPLTPQSPLAPLVLTAPGTPPPSTRAKRPLDSPTTPGPASPLKQRHQRHSPTPPPPATAAMPFVSPKGRGADAAAEQSRLFGSIARLCARLGVSQPQYRLVPDLDRPSFFSGRAEFSVGSRVPDDIAVVRNVLGKKQARIQIAEQVLAWMEKEEMRRQQLVDGMLS
ncbi:hypothetical protein CCM_02607 [Cordyceps militaris CM01]|uniref:DRBM domain-containing protein n=1 Tax=Cordyceps militaris (strain CM01) TaxID=983644 RepID=G3JAS3_CORMM|nr:uncharacterized protein CCM_02607 [Cordyceps militaris CM01]EGX94336.1 hypothetical protein CCM_02607 [Cordyceps militaris CM01]